MNERKEATPSRWREEITKTLLRSTKNEIERERPRVVRVVSSEKVS